MPISARMASRKPMTNPTSCTTAMIVAMAMTQLGQKRQPT
jgi:hypothetical protein